MADNQLVLPWGRRDETRDGEQIDDVPARLNLELGKARIDVRWVLHVTDSDEDDGNAAEEIIVSWKFKMLLAFFFSISTRFYYEYYSGGLPHW